MPLIAAVRRQRQADLSEFESSLLCKSEFQDRFQSYTEKPCLEINKTKQNKIN